MDTIERIEELKREIVKQKLLIESEEAKIEKVKRCCGVVAELLCAQCRELAEEVVWDILGHMIECSQKKISGNEKAGLKEAVKTLLESEEAKIEKVKRCCGVVAELLCAQCRELAEEVVWDILGHMIECSQKKISGNEKAGLKEAVKTLLEHEMKNLESLSADEEMWPHIDCRIQVNLDERLKKAQFELKGIENKMLDGTRAQLRKRAVQMEEMKSLCSRMEQAVLSIESWEKLYLMFMADMEIRRQSGMDDTFYLMEREDIRRKLQTCFEFTDIICRSLEERLRSSVRISVNNLGLLLAEHGFHFPKSLWNRTRTNIIYMGAIRLTEDMIEEINRYAAGIMFIEKHLHNIKLATDRVYRGQMELERLSGQSKTVKKLVV